MYNTNHLASKLRASSINVQDMVFAQRPNAPDVTYQELWQQAERYAAALVTLGLAPGDRVAVQVEKSIEIIELYLGTLLAGGVFLPLNTGYKSAEIEYFLEDCTPFLLVCDPVSSSSLEQVALKHGVKHVLTLASNGDGSLPDKVRKEDAGFEGVPRSPDDLAAVLYTSGTTGRSKGAMLTHENLASNAVTLSEYWEFTRDDVLIHALPVFHTHGLFVCTNVTLMAGSSVIFLTSFDADQILDVMQQATVLMGVPTFYTRLLKHPHLSSETVKNMRLFVSGSAPLLTETHQNWHQKTGHTILERYGMTETNMNTSNPYRGKRIAGTVGFPLPGVDVRVTDFLTGDTLPHGEAGSLEVRGPNVFKGYWRMPEKTRAEFRQDGYFITGDIGAIDEQGYVSIVGRSKDLVITGGYNVYPKEVETLLDEVYGVEETAVIGLPHPDFGEAVVAIIVTSNGHTLQEADILAEVAERIARFKQPKRLFFVDELPRNTMGKVQKNVLRERFKTTFHS